MILAGTGITLGLLVLTCGQVLFWLRRDNILAYVQGGLFLSTLFIPVVGTHLLTDFDPHVVRLYAQLLLVGAAFYMIGMGFGAPLGNRPIRSSRLTFTLPLVHSRLLKIVVTKARILSLLGVVALVAGFALQGYFPLLSADRVAAKYGLGSYQAGFERGALVYRFALAVASTALPVILALLYRSRRFLDLLLVGALTVGLALSMSRTLTFSGLLIVAVAVAIERRFRPGIVLAMATLAFIAGALINEIFFPPVGEGIGSLPSRVAASAPDVRDHLGFIRGYELRGEARPGWALLAGLTFGSGYWDPSSYAVRTLTGITNTEAIPSGGLRLPPPLWGYASFGFIGAAAWSFLAGLFTGWGTTRLKALLTDVIHAPGSSLNLTIAAIYYAGTFAVLSTFYFATSSMFVRIVMALYLGRVFTVLPKHRRDLNELALPESGRLHSRTVNRRPSFR